jgi:hypothetical protein
MGYNMIMSSKQERTGFIQAALDWSYNGKPLKTSQDSMGSCQYSYFMQKTRSTR